MALDQRLKDNLKSNTEYYKGKKDQLVKPEWGFPSTLDQVEAELTKKDLSDEDKKVLLDWMDAFEKIKIDNDTTAEARRERIKTEMQKLRNATTTPVVAANGVQKTKEELKSSVDEAMNSIDMKDIAKMKEGLDKLKLALTMPGLSASDKDSVLGYTGKMLIARIEQAGYKLTLTPNKQVSIDPASQTVDRSISTALSAMLNQDANNLQSIATGLIYSSSQFSNFIVINSSDENGVKTVKKPSTDYFNYLKDVTRSGGKTPSDEALIRSESAVRTILGLTPEKMQSLMSGHFNTGEWLKNNPTIAQNIAQAAQATPPVGTSTSPAVTPPSAKPSTSNTNVPKGTTNSEAPTNNMLAKYLGKAGLAIEGGASDILKTPGAVPALIVAFLATWIFGDFKKALMVLAGGVGISAVANAYGKTPEKEEPKEGKKSKNTTKAQPKQAPTNIPAPKAIDKTGLAGSRLAATEKVEKDGQLTSMVDAIRKSQAQTQGVETADLADYIAFINNELQSKKLSEIINPQDFRFSVFSDDEMFEKAGKNNLNTLMLKRVLRVYLGVDMRTTSPGTNMKKGEQEQKNFTERYKGAFSSPNNTLKDLMEGIK